MAFWRKTLQTNAGLLIILLLLILLPHIIGLLTGSDPFATRGAAVSWQGTIIEIYILAIFTISYNLLFGFSGVISFGHALFFGMGGYILGLALEYTELTPDMGIIVGIFGAVVICGVLGFLIGLASLRLRGVYFTVFTLAIAESFYIFWGRLPLTKGEDGFTLTTLPTWLNPIADRITFYYIVMVIFVLTFLFIRRLMFSPTGAVLLAIRENEERAKTIGYNTLYFKLMAFTVAAMIAALAGVLQVVFNKKVGPELLSVGYTIDPLLMTIIGGAGTFTGPVIGATTLHLLDRTLRDRVITFTPDFALDIGKSWMLISGFIFIIVVIVFPYGIVGTWNRWRAKRRPPITVSSGTQAPIAEKQSG